MEVVMVPSVGGGIGHISRTSALARTLVRLNPSVNVTYVLDTDRLRPFNVDATRRMGFEPKLLPTRTAENRQRVVLEAFGTPDLVVDDCSRYLIGLRNLLPTAAWVSILMHPIADELFMDWPYIQNMDAVIWAYPPIIDIPPDLDPVREKVVQTGPFLDLEGMSDKPTARSQLGFAEEKVVVYAPRGFPFGKHFGHTVLSGLYLSCEALRQQGRRLRLVLLAVSDAAQLHGVPDFPTDLPEWVSVRGVVSPSESLLHTQAADVVIGEGTSTIHEGAALKTAVIMVPGPIPEIAVLARRLKEHNCVQVIEIEDVKPEALSKALAFCLDSSSRCSNMVERAFDLVTGGGGVEAAARLLFEIVERNNAARHNMTPSSTSWTGQ